jgi:hypothetical protein
MCATAGLIQDVCEEQRKEGRGEQWNDDVTKSGRGEGPGPVSESTTGAQVEDTVTSEERFSRERGGEEREHTALPRALRLAVAAHAHRRGEVWLCLGLGWTLSKRGNRRGPKGVSRAEV